MSHFAHGWALRQQLNDPVQKAILKMMCYVMKDEALLVYVGIPSLVEYTEFDERTIRKGIGRLAELGWLLDTGKKRNNVTVWRIPGYERFLAESPGKNGRASGTDLRALAQVADLVKEKKIAGDHGAKPPQKGEGQENEAPSNLQRSPPNFVPQAPSNLGGNLNDLSRSPEGEGERAIPTGSSPSPSEALNRKDPRAMHWGAVAQSWVISECAAMGICKYGTTDWRSLPTNVRMVMPDKMDALVAWALDQERPPALKTYKVIERHLQCELTLELRVFKPSTPADRQAGYG